MNIDYRKNNVYCHSERIEPYPDCTKIAGVSAAILAGGASRRMGTNKALLKVAGDPLITRVYQTLAGLFHEVFIVTNTPEEYDFLPCRKVPDIFPGIGAIAGLHAAIVQSSSERTFVTACDMPSLDPEFIRRLCAIDVSAEAVVPLNRENLREPLHAIYAKGALPTIENIIEAGDKSILIVLDRLNTRLVGQDEIGGTESFQNVNTPEEYQRLKGAD